MKTGWTPETMRRMPEKEFQFYLSAIIKAIPPE